jgi:uncharacterized SAM-binding protein YcdF (DUF218 family)
MDTADIRDIVWSLVGPSGMFLILVLILAWPSRSQRSWRRWRRPIVGIILALLMLSPLGTLMLDPLERKYPQLPLNTRASGVILLTGAERLGVSDRAKRPEFGNDADRIIIGRILSEQNPRAILVLVGGIQLRTARDTEVLARTLVLQGVAPGRIRKINGTTDTCTNAQGVAKSRIVAPGERWLLVTSAYHMPRAMACFRAHGVQVTPFPADYKLPRLLTWGDYVASPWLYNLDRLEMASHEWTGLVYYWLTGRIDAIW